MLYVVDLNNFIFEKNIKVITIILYTWYYLILLAIRLYLYYPIHGCYNMLFYNIKANVCIKYTVLIGFFQLIKNWSYLYTNNQSLIK